MNAKHTVVEGHNHTTEREASTDLQTSRTWCGECHGWFVPVGMKVNAKHTPYDLIALIRNNDVTRARNGMQSTLDEYLAHAELWMRENDAKLDAAREALAEARSKLANEAYQYRDEDGEYQPHGKSLGGSADKCDAALSRLATG